PGNVRQLQNLVRRLVVLFDGGEITAQMIAAADIEGQGPGQEAAAVAPRKQVVLPMWQQEQRIIEDAIQTFGGNIALAAAAPDLSPSPASRWPCGRWRRPCAPRPAPCPSSAPCRRRAPPTATAHWGRCRRCGAA